jgi:hypothetical protein
MAMTLTQGDLDSFHHFATELLSRSGSQLSLEELLNQWNDRRDEADTIASIRRGVADAQAGRVQSLADVDARIRKAVGFPARGR